MRRVQEVSWRVKKKIKKEYTKMIRGLSSVSSDAVYSSRIKVMGNTLSLWAGKKHRVQSVTKPVMPPFLWCWNIFVKIKLQFFASIDFGFHVEVSASLKNGLQFLLPTGRGSHGRTVFHIALSKHQTCFYIWYIGDNIRMHYEGRGGGGKRTIDTFHTG